MGVNAPDPLQVSEILAYCQLVGIASLASRAKYLKLLQALDGIYLEHWHSTHPSPKTT